ncbi:RNase H domain-containing protein [Trichonephila clavipes]|nr:RNase H domain-containing protein [Trichonephila clavipes]
MDTRVPCIACQYVAVSHGFLHFFACSPNCFEQGVLPPEPLNNPDPSGFLRQLALEVVGNIPDEAFLLYTDGSRNEHSPSGVAILEKLERISSSREIHLQWAPSHVSINDNEIADSPEKDGAAQSTRNSDPLTYSELHSTYIKNKQSTVPPAHH